MYGHDESETLNRARFLFCLKRCSFMSHCFLYRYCSCLRVCVHDLKPFTFLAKSGHTTHANKHTSIIHNERSSYSLPIFASLGLSAFLYHPTHT